MHPEPRDTGRGFTGLLAFGALLPSWLGLLGDWHWALDLFSHFRWQHLVLGALVCGWALWGRRLLWVGVALATLLLNAWLIVRLAWPAPVDSTRLAPDFALRATVLNVLTANQDEPAVLQFLRASDADLLFLMEVNERWAAALAVLHADYPHRLVLPRPDNFGLALYSRVALERATVLQLGADAMPSVEARLQHQGRTITLIGTHPVPPMTGRLAARRDAQLRALSAHVARIDTPVLVLGDLNASPWSAGMRIATSGRLGFRSLAAPWRPTWRAGGALGIPIDHALVTTPLLITRRAVGPDVGSDHRPVQVSVGWEDGGAGQGAAVRPRFSSSGSMAGSRPANSR